jgi:hypothetical protein
VKLPGAAVASISVRALILVTLADPCCAHRSSPRQAGPLGVDHSIVTGSPTG